MQRQILTTANRIANVHERRTQSLRWVRCRLSIYCLATGCFTTAGVASATDFEEIEFWVGDGPNRAAMVVDWSEDPLSGPSLVWGFRFLGPSTGADMLQAVLRADPRFYAKLNSLEQPDDLGLSVNGLGYDWNGDGALPLAEGTQFDASGIATVESPSDFEAAADADDAYAEGWFAAGFWTYATAASSPFVDASAWEDFQFGASGRELTDGHWDAWTFAPSFLPAVPDSPRPAPVSSIPGDYDRDFDVDGADWLLLQRTYAAEAVPPGAGADGDRSGAIDPGDLAVWNQEFGAITAELQATSPRIVAPEPATGRLISTLIVAACLRWARRRQSATPIFHSLELTTNDTTTLPIGGSRLLPFAPCSGIAVR